MSSTLPGRGSYEVKNNSLRVQPVCLRGNCTGWVKKRGGGAEGKEAAAALETVCACVFRLGVALCYTLAPGLLTPPLPRSQSKY